MKALKASLSLSAPSNAWFSDLHIYIYTHIYRDAYRKLRRAFNHLSLCTCFTTPLCVEGGKRKELRNKNQSSAVRSYRQLNGNPTNNLLVLAQQMRCGRFYILTAKGLLSLTKITVHARLSYFYYQHLSYLSLTPTDF